jgi:hypothetical protein
MAEQQKLGPNITYTNPEGDAKLVNVGGVLLKEGESVNLVEKLGEATAAPLLRKFAQSPHFQVDGGPDWSQKREAQSQGPDASTAAYAQQEEQRIRRTQGDDAADKYVASLGKDGRPEGGQPEPANQAEARYQGPAEPTLEKPAARRKE